MLIAIIASVVLIGGLVSFGVLAFNRLRWADIGVSEALGGIDVQLTRRAELIPHLVSTVKGYAAHERSVLDEATKARTAVSAAATRTDVEARAEAEAALERALVDVLAVAEAYPDLKASANFQQLQSDLTDTENQMAFARQYYNDSVRKLNELIKTIPWMFFAGVAQVSERDFYRAPEAQRRHPGVEF